MFIKVIDNTYISNVSLVSLKQEYPAETFSSDFLTKENPNLVKYNVVYCTVLDIPQYDVKTEILEAKLPELLDMNWVQGWIVRSKREEELEVSVVSMVQARKALAKAGKLDIIEQAIQSLGGEALIDWEYNAMIHRDSNLVNQVAGLLGWTTEELNLLFEIAKTL